MGTRVGKEQSDFCLCKNSPWLKVTWHIEGFTKSHFFPPTRKVFGKCAGSVSQSRMAHLWPESFLFSLLCCWHPLLCWDTALESFYTQQSRNSPRQVATYLLVLPQREGNKSVFICMSPWSKFLSHCKSSVNTEEVKAWRKITDFDSATIIRWWWIR